MDDTKVDFGRLGKTLRNLREQLELTQKELEERSGIADTLISRLETGSITDPKLSTLNRVAQGLGIDLSELIEKITTKNENRETIQAKIENVKEELRERFHVKEIGIFGSVARGEDTPDSDVDLLVEYEDGHRDIFNHSRLESLLEKELNRSIDLVMKYSKEGVQHSRIQQNINEDLIRV